MPLPGISNQMRVNPGFTWTIADLYQNGALIPTSVPFSITLDGHTLSNEAFLRDFAGKSLHVEYDAPLPGTVYAFRESTVTSINVGEHTTLADVARQLRGSYLLDGVISFTFWRTDLDVRRRVLSFGLPPGCEIAFRVERCGTLSVAFAGEISRIDFGFHHTAADLRAFVVRRESDSRFVFHDGVLVMDDQPLADFKEALFTVARAPIEKLFTRGVDSPLRLGLAPTATAADAVAHLASRCRCHPALLKLAVDLATPAAALPETVHFTILREIAFVFEGEAVPITADPSTTLGEARAALEARVRSRVALMGPEGEALDERCPICRVPRQIVAAAVAVELTLVLTRGRDVERMTVSARACDSAEDVRAKYAPDFTDPEFVVTERGGAGEWRRVDADARVGEIDFGGLELGLRERDAGVLQNFDFVIEEEKMEIAFPKGATVGEAKVAVAKQLGVVQEDVMLFFCGKLLRNEFRLDRVVRNERPISIVVRQKEAVRLMSARSVRRSATVGRKPSVYSIEVH
jgi:hypothetical protein